MVALPSRIIIYTLGLLLVHVTRVTPATISSSPAQTFNGIGGSGAWWPNDLWHFPEATRQNLASLLFSQSGLGLSSYRYNIGAGGVNVSNPTRAPETFFVRNGVYNFDADQQGRYFLNEAAKRGVSSLTAFANSAPPSLTSGGASCNGRFVSGTYLDMFWFFSGIGFDNSCSRVSGNGDAYGTFLADVISHFHSQGVNISLISPMNEPDSNFGPSPCGQEGMQVLPNQ